MYFYSSLFNTK